MPNSSAPRREADDANVSKTRFVAAASHDILQPLNAARLYVTSLIERQRGGEDGDLVRNIDASLEAVEEIFARAARYFAARHRRDEAGNQRISASTNCCSGSRSNSRRWRGEKGLDA